MENNWNINSFIDVYQLVCQELVKIYCIGDLECLTLTSAIVLTMCRQSKTTRGNCESNTGISKDTFKVWYTGERYDENKCEYKKRTVHIALKMCLGMANNVDIAKHLLFSIGFLASPLYSEKYKRVCLEIIEKYCCRRNLNFTQKFNFANEILVKNGFTPMERVIPNRKQE